MTLKIVLSSLVAAASIAMPAQALTITSVFGNWENVTTENAPANGAGTPNLSWGRPPAGGAQSAYDFEGTQTPFVTSIGETFPLGTFTHRNNPIFIDGALLKTADLAVTFTVAGSSDTYKSVFTFSHNETQNDLFNCANGLNANAPINSNGCADVVSVDLNVGQSQGFNVNGQDFLLDISGFLYTDDQGQTSLLDHFLTKENANNNAFLQASYRLVSDPEPKPDDPNDPDDPDTPDTPSEVPLPASGLLLLAGIVALSFGRRRS